MGWGSPIWRRKNSRVSITILLLKYINWVQIRQNGGSFRIKFIGRKVTLGCSAIVHKLHWRPSSIILDKVTLGQTWSWRWHWRLPSSSGYWMTFGEAAHLYLGKSVTEHGTYLSTPLHRLWIIQKSCAVSCRRNVHIFQLNLGMGTKALMDQDQNVFSTGGIGQ